MSETSAQPGPCPFCKSEDTHECSFPAHNEPRQFYIRCYECGARGPDDPNRSVAQQKWNELAKHVELTS